MTPTELLIDVMSREGFDDVRQIIVLSRKQDGTIGIRIDDSQFAADTMGLLDFAKLSVEQDLKRAWSEDGDQ